MCVYLCVNALVCVYVLVCVFLFLELLPRRWIVFQRQTGRIPLPLATLVFEECCSTHLFSLQDVRMKIPGPELWWLENPTPLRETLCIQSMNLYPGVHAHLQCQSLVYGSV